jgi:ribonuclease P protein component
MTFKKEERLKSEKVITQLFRKGHSFACYPLRLVYAELPNPELEAENPKSQQTSNIQNPKSEIGDPLSISGVFEDFEAFETVEEKATKTPLSPVQFALSVPKKAFKRAVDRNVLRRRIREAYRLNKIDLYRFLENKYSNEEKRFAFMVLYTAKEEMPYVDIEKGIKKMIRKFKDELNNAKK